MADISTALTDPKRRQALLLGVAVVLGLLFVFRAGWNWHQNSMERLEESIELKSMQYEKLMGLLAEADKLNGEHKALLALEREMVEKRFIKEATVSLSEAAFQNFVKELIQKHGLELRTMKSLPLSKRKDGVETLNLNINVKAEIGPIRDFLMSVRNSGKFVYFTELEIKSAYVKEPRFFNLSAKLAALTQES